MIVSSSVCERGYLQYLPLLRGDKGQSIGQPGRVGHSKSISSEEIALRYSLGGPEIDGATLFSGFENVGQQILRQFAVLSPLKEELRVFRIG